MHATFTFTMGAMLFERLVIWGPAEMGRQRRRAGLSQRDLARARLSQSRRNRVGPLLAHRSRLRRQRVKWLTRGGKQQLVQLADALAQIEQAMSTQQAEVATSSFGPALRRHRATLAHAAKSIG